MQIFKRTNQGVLPTDDGIRLIHEARSILARCEDLKFISSSQKFSTLRVVSHRFEESVNAYLKTLETLDEESKFIFKYDILGSFNIFKQVYYQNAEIGVLIAMTPVEDEVRQLLRGKHLIFNALIEVPYYLIIRKDHPYLNSLDTLFSKLNSETYCHSMESMSGNDFLILFKKCFGFINFNRRIYIPNRDLQLDYIASHRAFGVGLRIDSTSLEKRNLVQIPIPQTNARVGYIKTKSSFLSPEATSFIQFLEEELLALKS